MQMYGASVTLGVGGSTLLVTVLTMLADLIGDNVVRLLSRDRCVVLLVFTFCSGRLNAGFDIFHRWRTKRKREQDQTQIKGAVSCYLATL